MENGVYPLKGPNVPASNYALFTEFSAGRTASLRHRLRWFRRSHSARSHPGSSHLNPLICSVCLSALAATIHIQRNVCFARLHTGKAEARAPDRKSAGAEVDGEQVQEGEGLPESECK